MCLFIMYIIINMDVKIAVVLTQWKRNHLEKQLVAISNQNVKIDYIIVFQNENHVDVTDIVKKFSDVIHVKSDFNTKFFGRFSYLFTIPVDICIVMDDDIIPGPKCVENYVNQCIKTNAIIGGNGRIGINNVHRSKLKHSNDVGTRNMTLVDFVGHMWCFKKEWLYYMFSCEPYTYDTGEDMHLCFSSKLFGNIDSYVAGQKTKDECSDLANNTLANDKYSSFKTINQTIRSDVELFWMNKGLKLISQN